MDFPRSFWIMRAISTCDNSRSRPRMVPSTSRRYRSFSPSVISQSVITILQIAIDVKGKNEEAFSAHFAMIKAAQNTRTETLQMKAIELIGHFLSRVQTGARSERAQVANHAHHRQDAHHRGLHLPPQSRLPVHL